MITKALKFGRDAGLGALGRRAVAFAYRRAIRPWLPIAGPVHYAGIPVVYDRKWGDNFVPALWRTSSAVDIPDYESALIAGLKGHVHQGDRVVVVGGGIGVTATVAALMTGEAGHVHCYEGGAERIGKICSTAARNGVAERVTVHHAIVACSISVWGTAPSQAAVSPDQLPECDVLELDCEGAEVDILREMTIHPRVVLVETHGLYGATTDRVASLLECNGYQVTVLGVAEPRHQQFCEEHDIRVVIGIREDSDA